MDIDDKNGKEMVEEKKKEPIFFKGVPLIDLDDCIVSDNRLHCNSDDSDDNDAPNLEYIDVGNGGASSSLCLEPNTSPAAELLQSSIQVYSARPSEATLSGSDPLFNAAGKALHPDVVNIK